MRRLIYASRWTKAVVEDTELALQQIVAKSIQNNRAGGLTGFLLAFDGVFLQVLEGASSDISATYQRIERDPRHERLRIFADETIPHRQFSNWNMCGVSLKPSEAILTQSRWTKMASADARFDAAAVLELITAVARQETERERHAVSG